MATVCIGCGLDVDADGALEVKRDPNGGITCDPTKGLAVKFPAAGSGSIVSGPDGLDVKICATGEIPFNACNQNLLFKAPDGCLGVLNKIHGGQYLGTTQGNTAAAGGHNSRGVQGNQFALQVDVDGLGKYYHRDAAGNFVLDCTGLWFASINTGCLGSTGKVTGGRARIARAPAGTPNLSSTEIDDYNKVVDYGKPTDGPEFNSAGMLFLPAGTVLSPQSEIYTAAAGQGVNIRALFDLWWIAGS